VRGQALTQEENIRIPVQMIKKMKSKQHEHTYYMAGILVNCAADISNSTKPWHSVVLNSIGHRLSKLIRH